MNILMLKRQFILRFTSTKFPEKEMFGFLEKFITYEWFRDWRLKSYQVTAWRSAMKLPDGLTFLAERQTCSNKMNERAALEMFEKMQRYWRMHSHCVYTDFRVESHN